MDRFIAMFWDDAIASRNQRALAWCELLTGLPVRWQVVLERPGLRILCLPSRGKLPITHFGNEHGLVVGTIFEKGREHAAPFRSITPKLADEIIASAGDTLCSDWWGSYVALWRNVGTRTVELLRDPCGALPCFLTEIRGVTLACSYIADLTYLPGFRPSTDWAQVRAFLTGTQQTSTRTSLREVGELLPGEHYIWRPKEPHSRRWAWNGAELAGQSDHRSFDEARAEVRGLSEACLAGWTRTSDHVLVRMSGGLDSTIIATLANRTKAARVTGFHFTSQGHEGFEDRLARLAAGHAGIDLVEQDAASVSTGLHSLMDLPPLVRPTRHALGLQADARVAAVCEDMGVDTIMTGHGGDALFLQRSLAKSVLADHIIGAGFDARFLQLLYETAMLLEWSVWDVMRHTLGQLRRSGDRPAKLVEAHPDQPALVDSEMLAHDASSVVDHPWMSASGRLPPAKRGQLRSIIGLRDYQPVLGTALGRTTINPWVSQPVVEFCLKTPTTHFIAGGRDRALERAAFQNIIPVEVSNRTLKGYIDGSLLSTIRHNLKFLTEFVLDGELLLQPWIDRAVVEDLLSVEPLSRGDGLIPVCNLAVTEAWLRSWNV